MTNAEASSKRVGASIDADGKGNVWAVEPKMQVRTDIHGKWRIPLA